MATPIQHVFIYSGHENFPGLGPYHGEVKKQNDMFLELNKYRVAQGKNPWKVSQIVGEHLIENLEKENPKAILLVFPAGQSTHYDKVFSVAETTFLRLHFFEKGGRGYFTCGSAYWVSRVRVYTGVCAAQPENPERLKKLSILPLFQGLSEGPLCPFPGEKYSVGFYSDAVEVIGLNGGCSVYLSGGGSFILDDKSDQKVSVIARYSHKELIRFNVLESKLKEKEVAAIRVSVGEGGAVLSMFHPDYGDQDIDIRLYERMFPDCGTDWKRVHEKLSSYSARMNFVFNTLISSIETVEG